MTESHRASGDLAARVYAGLVGFIFLSATAVQVMYWVHSVTGHPVYLPDMYAAIFAGPTFVSRVMAAIGTLSHVLFVGVLATLVWVGVQLLLMAMNRQADVTQDEYSFWRMVKATIFLAVVFVISFWIAPGVNPPDPMAKSIGIWLLGYMMAMYSFFAIDKYFKIS